MDVVIGQEREKRAALCLRRTLGQPSIVPVYLILDVSPPVLDAKGGQQGVEHGARVTERGEYATYKHDDRHSKSKEKAVHGSAKTVTTMGKEKRKGTA